MAITQSITKKFNPNFKDVSYLSKNFPEFRQNLIEFAKSYYPQTYSDFNEASPGMMFIEMAAYVGDVMSFYIDNQFKENLLTFANERRNVISIAQSLGYKPRLAAAATVEAEIFQMVPALGGEDNYEPDSRFFLKISRNSKFSSNTTPSQIFRSTEDVDFSDPNNRTIRVFSREPVSGTPTMYVASKKIKLIAADIKTTTFTFGSAKKFNRVELPDNNIISIISVTDSDQNIWSEVDYLGQDVIIEERDITPRSMDGFLSLQESEIESPRPSKLAIYRKKPRRFVSRVNQDSRMELWFGSGESNTDDPILQLNASQIANDKYNQSSTNFSLDPADFLASDTFGLSPANTTLTVTYLVGGGITSNVPSGTIRNVESINVENDLANLEQSQRGLFNLIVEGVTINNEEPATGGGDIETLEEIRQNALAFFNAQNRVVTDKDYLVRTLSIPSNLGNVAKAFIVRDEQINNILTQREGDLTVNIDDNPFNDRRFVENPVAPNSVNIYVLGYNANRNLATLNTLVKQNLAKYLEQFRILTDEVNILDAFVVNIAVDFDIVVYRNYNMNDVLARCIDAVKDFFDVDKWQINQPIILNDLRLAIGSIDGVQTVTNVTVKNKYRFKDGRDYQEYRYPINEATIDDIIYPSLDPCIFELRYPETDIVGHARQ
jgi:hypothetical protein